MRVHDVVRVPVQWLGASPISWGSQPKMAGLTVILSKHMRTFRMPVNTQFPGLLHLGTEARHARPTCAGQQQQGLRSNQGVGGSQIQVWSHPL